MAAGELGDVWNVHGGYLQDWLLYPTDWNWRLEPDKGGALRAIGDIGSHWMDMAQFVSGQRGSSRSAPISTRRSRCGGGRSARSRRSRARTDVEREDAPMATEDLGHVLVRFDGGARGAFKVSQGAAGRKNFLHFEVDGSEAALAWNAERHEELWLGRRDEPNAVLQRNAALMQPSAAAHTFLPAGHAEGWVETFRELYRSVYAAVAAGAPSERARLPDLRRTGTARTCWATRSPCPTQSDDGWRYRHEARAPDRCVPSAPPRRGRVLGGDERLRDARGRLLAGVGRRATHGTPASPTSTSSGSTRRRCETCSTVTASRSPRSRTTRTTSTPIPASGAPPTRTCGRSIDAAAALGVPTVGTFVGRDQTKNVPDNFREFRKVWPRLVAYAEDRKG